MLQKQTVKTVEVNDVSIPHMKGHAPSKPVTTALLHSCTVGKMQISIGQPSKSGKE